MQLSIIVPVYNVEKYLKRCLDSLLNQNFDNYEIIIVNDGSTDSCINIINDYEKKYPQIIKAFNKENGGIASARNFGLEKSKGEYISFIDSDDYVEKDHYRKMYELAKKENSDLVVTDFEYFWEDEKKDTLYKKGIENVNPNLNKCMFLSPLFSWNKMYKRDTFIQLECKYPEGLWYEDIPVTLAYVSQAKKISYLPELGFHYTQRSTSIMGTKNSDKMYDIFTIFEKVLNYFKQKDLFNTYYQEIEYLFVEHFLVYGAFRFLRTDNYKDIMNKAFDFVNGYFPKCKKNRYIYTLGSKNKLFLITNNKITMGLWHKFLLGRN